MNIWYGRLIASFSVGIFIYALLWLAAQFREGPGFSIWNVFLLLIIYLSWEVIILYQNKTNLWSNNKYGIWTYPILIFVSTLVGTAFFLGGFYIFKWVDYFVNNNEQPSWGHMLMSLLVGAAVSLLFTTISISLNWRNRLIASEMENEGYRKLPEGFWQEKFESLFNLLKQKQNYKQRFLLKIGNSFLPVTSNEISYFYRDELVFASLADGKSIAVDYSLNQLTDLLDPSQFVRLNRQFLVNITAIEKLIAYKPGQVTVQLRPEASEEIVLSQERSAYVKKLLG